VAQPVTATVTQGAGVPTVDQTIFVPQQPGYPAQSPYPPQPGQQLAQATTVYPSAPPQTSYPSQPPGYYQAEPYPPIDQKLPMEVNVNPDPYPPSQPILHDTSGQPVPPDPTQQQNENFDECACYCTIL